MRNLPLRSYQQIVGIRKSPGYVYILLPDISSSLMEFPTVFNIEGPRFSKYQNNHDINVSLKTALRGFSQKPSIFNTIRNR